MKTNNRGFTLIELLVVVAIISLLAAIAVPNVIGRLRRAKMVKAEGDIRGFETAIEMFYTDTGYLPFKALSAHGRTMLVIKHGLELYSTGMLEAILKTTQYYADQSYFRSGVADTVARNYLSDGIPRDPWNQEYVYVERVPRRMHFLYAEQVVRDFGLEDIVSVPGEDEDSNDSLMHVVLDWRGQRPGWAIDRDFYLWSWGEEWADPRSYYEDDITNWQPNKPYAEFYR